jgi:hypothetical protein
MSLGRARHCPTLRAARSQSWRPRLRWLGVPGDNEDTSANQFWFRDKYVQTRLVMRLLKRSQTIPQTAGRLTKRLTSLH